MLTKTKVNKLKNLNKKREFRGKKSKSEIFLVIFFNFKVEVVLNFLKKFFFENRFLN